MRKDYGKVKCFRLDKDDEKLLNECIDILHITKESFNQQMSVLIPAIHSKLKEMGRLETKVKQLEQEVKKLEKVQKEVSIKSTEQIKKPVTPSTLQPTQKEKPLVLNTNPDVIWCPDKEEWLHKVKCDVCKTIHFTVFKDCQDKRLKNPNDPLFKPTKPKPIDKYQY
mgnify:CR=1 FL=1